MKRGSVVLIAGILLIAGGVIYWMTRQPNRLVFTGIVATDDVQVSSMIEGRLQNILVHQGDTVKTGQLLAVIQPQELQADKNYYTKSEEESSEHVAQASADLTLLEVQTREKISQSEATLAMDRAQEKQAQADMEYAEISFKRAQTMRSRNANSKQDYDLARTTYSSAKAHVDEMQNKVQAAEADLASARAGIQEIDARKAALAASQKHLAAAGALTQKSEVLLGYTKIYAPINGIVDVRAALQGEVVTPGKTILTLIDPDNLWIRADVEESYIDRIRIGDELNVRFPSGLKREGKVYYRGVDADYATQRDVSRTKRDIKTFEIRLRCDNSDRKLALGMTAFVTLPLR